MQNYKKHFTENLIAFAMSNANGRLFRIFPSLLSRPAEL